DQSTRRQICQRKHRPLAGWAQEPGHAGHQQHHLCLRGVLHELRARLPVGGIAAVGNHLPAVQRGVFYQDWLPADPLPTPDLADFEASLAQRLLPHIHMPDGITADVLWLVRTESEPFDAVAIRAALPAPLAVVWDESVS